ncbi:MAG: CBS domain-containing protein [Gemmatimonadota bacterium]|nr:CBS domain-containing protein [Gemmatimonadota bacterium]
MLKVRDVMSRDIVAFEPEAGLLDAIEVLAERHISGAPVLVGERIVGVLSSSDILEFVASNPVALADYGDSATAGASEEWSALAGHTVGEAMSGGPACTLAPDHTVQEAAELMRTSGIHRVFVVDRERLVGVVSSLDITKALADHKLGTRTYVFPDRGPFQ